jgi:hypothetical protein
MDIKDWYSRSGDEMLITRYCESRDTTYEHIYQMHLLHTFSTAMEESQLQ